MIDRDNYEELLGQNVLLINKTLFGKEYQEVKLTGYSESGKIRVEWPNGVSRWLDDGRIERIYEE